jgi:hypothetical protein
MSTPNVINVPRDTFSVAQAVYSSLPVIFSASSNVACLNTPDAGLAIDEERTIRSGLYNNAITLAAVSSSGFGIGISGARDAIDEDVGVILRYDFDFSCDVPYTTGGSAGDSLVFRMVLLRANGSISGSDTYAQSSNFMLMPKGTITYRPGFEVGISLQTYRVEGSAHGSIATFGAGVNAGEHIFGGVSIINPTANTFGFRNFVMSGSLHYWLSDQQTLNPNI